MFTKTRSFGPRITLTDKQVAAVELQASEAGLIATVEQCSTGSVYVQVYLPKWEQNIRNEWYIDADSYELAKIRLSGHDEGCRQDSTHNVIGSKSECMAALKMWVAELCEQNKDEAALIRAAQH